MSFSSCNSIKKETLAQGFSCEFSKVWKNTFFIVPLWITASIIQQLMASYFAIIYSWQLSSSKKLLVKYSWEKIHPYISRVFTDLDFFLFFIFFDKGLIYLASSLWVVGYLWVANCFVGSETPKHNNFDQFWKFKFRFKHFPRNTRFLSFDVPSNYFYLFKNNQPTFSWTGECPSSYLKVTKMWLGPNIKYISEPFFAGFCYREGITCFYYIGYIIRLTCFLQTEYFHCMWYLKTLDAHLVVPFATVAAICYKISIIWLNIIMRVVFPTDIIYIKKQRDRSTAKKLFIGL